MSMMRMGMAGMMAVGCRMSGGGEPVSALETLLGCVLPVVVIWPYRGKFRRERAKRFREMVQMWLVGLHIRAADAGLQHGDSGWHVSLVFETSRGRHGAEKEAVKAGWFDGVCCP
jgi:hypothetical protein